MGVRGVQLPTKGADSFMQPPATEVWYSGKGGRHAESGGHRQDLNAHSHLEASTAARRLLSVERQLGELWDGRRKRAILNSGSIWELEFSLRAIGEIRASDPFSTCLDIICGGHAPLEAKLDAVEPLPRGRTSRRPCKMEHHLHHLVEGNFLHAQIDAGVGKQLLLEGDCPTGQRSEPE